MSSQTTLRDMHNATSSPASPGGAMALSLQAGMTIDESGPAHVHVSRFQAPASKKVISTNDTFGPLFSLSSPSADLQWSLESRLQARLASNGCLPFDLTWKAIDMPAGLPAFQVSSRVRPSRGNGFIGWPAPTAQDAMGSRNRTSSRQPGAIFHGGTTLTDAAVLFGLPRSQWKAPTIPGVYCHPELSSWLMGYPKAWDACAPTAMPSSRKSRRK